MVDGIKDEDYLTDMYVDYHAYRQRKWLKSVYNLPNYYNICTKQWEEHKFAKYDIQQCRNFQDAFTYFSGFSSISHITANRSVQIFTKISRQIGVDSSNTQDMADIRSDAAIKDCYSLATVMHYYTQYLLKHMLKVGSVAMNVTRRNMVQRSRTNKKSRY